MRVDKRESRSRRSKALNAGLGLFGSRLITPGPPTPAGSPELNPPESVYKTCVVRQRFIAEVKIRVYDINPISKSVRENFIPPQLAALDLTKDVARNKSAYQNAGLYQIQSHETHDITSHDYAVNTRRKRKHIYFFAGGSWQSPASKHHWNLCAYLVTELTKRGHPTTVSIVSYPLALNNDTTTSLDMLQAFYREIMPSTRPNTPEPNGSTTPPSPSDAALALHKTTTYIHSSEEVIIAGDSSGGNVALSMVLEALSHPTSPPPAPVSLLLICPALDLRLSNPEIPAISQHDPILGRRFAAASAAAWTRAGPPTSDPRVSPLLADLAPLARAGTRLHGVVAGFDVLGPDARALRRRCAEVGVGGCWLEWEGMMHCWPLAFSFGFLPEAKEAVEWMVKVLAEE